MEIKSSITTLEGIFTGKKIKTIPLKVSAPFHCKLMKPAADNMKDKINNTKFENPKYKSF